MTINEAISRIDDLKHNTYEHKDKLEWLSRLDSMVKRLVIDTHDGGEDVSFAGYTDATDIHTELLIPAPYDEAYLRYMEAQIDYTNGEYEKYNNSIEAFNASWTAYQNYYNRTHMPKGKSMKFF
jgi:hypothetical protein